MSPATALHGTWLVPALTKFSYIPLLALLAVAGCQTAPQEKPAATEEQLVLKRASFSDLSGWNDQDNGAAPALAKSCPQLLKKGTAKPAITTPADWQDFCAAVKAGQSPRIAAEKYLQPYRATSRGGNEAGLFTGYYEPLIRASRTRGGAYQYPLYKRPSDMIDVDLGAFKDSLKGQKITGRVTGTKLVPYYERSDIADGALANKNNEILWADNAIDPFFLEIQGSGRAELPDGSHLRIGYAGQNGYPYFAIGRKLKDDGEIAMPVTMQKIRAWLAQHPDRQQEIFNTNPSYVFFRELDQDGAIGAANLPLTAEHSLAVDPKFYSYNQPLWLATTTPDGAPFNRMIVAQDTGGAIKGAVRGDVFFGFGKHVEETAGAMQQPGALYVLLPKAAKVD